MAIFSPVTGAATSILSTITSQTWGPLVSICKNGTLSQLQEIKLGKLVLFEGGASKASFVFGSDKEGVPVAFLDVHSERFWVRLALFADMVRHDKRIAKADLAARRGLIWTAGFCRELHARRGLFARSDQVFRGQYAPTEIA
jgi:hypothetical protein